MFKYSQVFYKKTVLMSLLFNKVLRLQAKERLLHSCFPVSFAKYFRALFLRNTSGLLLLLNTFFFFVPSTSPTKNVSFNFGYFKYFRSKDWIARKQFFVKVLDSQLWLSWFIDNKESDMSEMLLEIRSSRPAVFCKNEILHNFF